eukprot:scaffold546727_cov15-Prasinocladus_malaysianus.AAC.1
MGWQLLPTSYEYQYLDSAANVSDDQILPRKTLYILVCQHGMDRQYQTNRWTWQDSGFVSAPLAEK